MSNLINKQSREYITKNPVRSSIGAIGYGTVESINLAVDVIGVGRQATSLVSKHLESANLEADVENLEIQIELNAKRAELTAKLDSMASA